MFSVELVRINQEIAAARRAHRAAQVVSVALLLALSACAALNKAVTECRMDRAAERVVARALDGAEPATALKAEAVTLGVQVVTCALWSIVRSLTANAQDSSVESHQPAAWTARRAADQYKLDAARSWLQQNGQLTEPQWRR